MIEHGSKRSEGSSRLPLAAKCAIGGVAFLLAIGAPFIGRPAFEALGSEEDQGATEEVVHVDADAAPAPEPMPVPEPEPVPTPEPSEPAYEGSQLVDRYLAGETLTYEELASIDLDALSIIDPDLASELKALMEASAPDAGDGSDDVLVPPEAEPVDPSAPDGSAGDVPEAEEPEAGATDGDADAASRGEGAASSDQSALYPAWDYAGDTSFTMIHYTDDMTTSKFIAAVGEQARAVAQENGVYASVMIAQAVIESESGTAPDAQTPNNDLFGLKRLDNGVVVIPAVADAVSVEGGEAHPCTYASMKESLEDYASQISGHFAYRLDGATKAKASTWQEAAQALEEGFAGEAGYADRIAQIVDAYDLTRYDEPLSYEAAVPLQKTVFDEEAQENVTIDRSLVDLVAEATSHLGTPYVWGGSHPETGLDCSGFVQLSYRDALGIDLPRTSYYQCLEGADVDFSDLHMGDLLFFVDAHGTVGHVAMYLADGYYIESTTRTGCNAITSMDENRPDFAKRVIPCASVPDEGFLTAEAAE